jgi:hypothetical protein
MAPWWARRSWKASLDRLDRAEVALGMLVEQLLERLLGVGDELQRVVASRWIVVWLSRNCA